MSSRREKHKQRKILFATCLGTALVLSIFYLLAKMGPGRGTVQPMPTQSTVDPEYATPSSTQSEAELIVQSKQFEAEGLHWQKEGDFDKAKDAFRAAAEFQYQINTQYPESESVDIRRLLQLQQQVEETLPQAVYAESLALEQKGNVAAEEGNWEEAAENFSKALELQQHLNRDFQGVPQVNWARMHLLRTRLATVQSENLAIKIEKLTEQAKDKEAQQEYAKATELWNKARREQETLNQNFPESQYAAPEKINQLKNNAEKALSFEPVQAILQEYEALVQALRTQQMDTSVSKINSLVRSTEKLQEEFSYGSYLDPNIVLQIQYLHSIQDDLQSIWDELHGKWLPLPENPNVMLLSVEVPQVLFSALMKGNPSRNLGEQLPVDSVIWEDIQIFCRNLSWILNQEVRLPTETEFRSAVGSVDSAELEASSWHRNNSQSQTHPVGERKPNALGYFDLLGNVAEWVQPTEETKRTVALVAGGSAVDSLDLLRSVPFQEDP